MLNWYLRQGTRRQMVVLGVVIVATPFLWNAMASFFFIDLMGHGMRLDYPRSDIGSYFVWQDYFLSDGQPPRVRLWLAVSGVAAAVPFAGLIVRLAMDHSGRGSRGTGGGKRPSLYGKSGWADEGHMHRGGIGTKRDI
jgi:hypothetical protein